MPQRPLWTDLLTLSGSFTSHYAQGFLSLTGDIDKSSPEPQKHRTEKLRWNCLTGRLKTLPVTRTRILIGEMCGVRWCSAATVGPNVHAQLLLCLLHLKAIDALEFHWDTCIYTCIYTRIYTETVWQTAASTTFMFQRLPLCVCACAAFETRWLHFFTPSWTRGARRAAWAHCSQGFSDAIFFFFLAFSAMKIFGIIQIFQKNKKIKKMRLGSVWLCVCRIKC